MLAVTDATAQHGQDSFSDRGHFVKDIRGSDRHRTIVHVESEQKKISPRIFEIVLAKQQHVLQSSIAPKF